jgi:hypothetical protein
MAINAVKKLLNGDTPFTDVDVGTGTVGTTELAASCITAAKIATGAVNNDGVGASAIAKGELKYQLYVWSFIGNGSAGPGNGASAAISVAVGGGAQVIGFYFTKYICTSAASYVNTITIASTTSTCFTLSPAYGLKSTADVLEGVLITIEA